MNTFIQFVDRVWELEFLEGQLAKPASFVVLYGRRRVGKSELIKQFIKGKKAIYLLATQEVEKGLMESFSAELAGFFKDTTLAVNPFSQFKQVMEYLKERGERGLIVAIDEFPYLVDANRAVPSILQKYWDTHFKERGLHIILCGSSVGSMETEALGRKSPLYGRRTGQWNVNPLPFREYIKFFPATLFERVIEFYAITGGIPLYILEFDGKKSAYENAKTVIATRGSLLYQEADVLLKEELREPKTYFSILKELSAGKNTISELSNALGVERTALVRYLDTLVELDMVERVQPITALEKSRKAAYALKDNYFRFWFTFVYPHVKDLDSFLFTGFEQGYAKKFPAYAGKRFEEVCREALAIGSSSTTTGVWWGAYRDVETGERKTAEIDIVQLDEKAKEIVFCECKWQEGTDAMKELAALKEKAKLVQWNNGIRKERYALFSKSFRERIQEPDLMLFDLKDMERLLKGGRLTSGKSG